MQNAKILKPGNEQHEDFFHDGKMYVQYDYRSKYGDLFSALGSSLLNCKKKRTKWARKKYELLQNEINAICLEDSSLTVW